jgi:hypothetical protein
MQEKMRVPREKEKEKQDRERTRRVNNAGKQRDDQ